MVTKSKLLQGSLAVATMFSVLLAGCSGNNAESNASVPASQASTSGNTSQSTDVAAESEGDPFAERVSLSLGYWGSGTWGNDQWYQDFSKKFNVDMKFTNLDWADWEQKIRLMATSGDLPDFTAGPLPSNDYTKFAQQGILKALPDDLSAYPHLQKYLSAEIVDNFRVDGKLYVVPRALSRDLANIVTAYKIVYRKDWLQELGLPAPQTYEEFLEMNRQFAEKKLGGKDTVGFTNQTLDMAFYPFLHGMGSASDSWEQVGGQWVPGIMNKKNVDWLTLERKYYKLGAIDPDFAINKMAFGSDKFTKGTAGSAVFGMSTKDYETLMNNFEEANPGKKAADSIGLLMYPKNQEGVMQIQNDTGIGTGTYFNADISDQQMDRALRMLDYFLSDEGLRFAIHGVEGRDYKMDGDTIVMTTPVDESTGKPKDLGVLYPTANGMRALTYWIVDYTKIDKTIPQALRDEVSGYEDTMVQQGVKEARNYDIDFMSTPAKDKWNYLTTFSEGFAKIILSDDDVGAMFDQLVQQALANGGNVAIKEVNEKLASMQ